MLNLQALGAMDDCEHATGGTLEAWQRAAYERETALTPPQQKD